MWQVSGFEGGYSGDRGALYAPAAELDAEHAQKVLEMEHAQQAKLKERQKFFEEAFQQDMEQYLSTGYLQIGERRGEPGNLGARDVTTEWSKGEFWDTGCMGVRGGERLCRMAEMLRGNHREGEQNGNRPHFIIQPSEISYRLYNG